MTTTTLEEIYHEQLQDLFSACRQSLDVTTELGRAASDTQLSQALIDGTKGIASGMDALKSLCAEHGVEPEGERCKGMQGLVSEARSHALSEDINDDSARDAIIISQYQRLVHYALAGYGCLVAFANQLEHNGDAAVLQSLLDETYDGDRRMTEIATKGGVNKAAA